MDLAKFYDAPSTTVDPRQAAAATPTARPATTPTAPAPSRQLSEAERLSRFYDASKDSRPAPAVEPRAQAEQQRLAAFYDSAEAQAVRALAGEEAPAPAAAPKATTPTAAAAVPGAFTLPEGFDPKDPLVGEFRQVAGEMKLDGKGATKLLALHQRVLAAQGEAIAQQAAAWRQEVEADAEVQAHATEARELVQRFGDPALLELLGDDRLGGLGNHPGLVRFVTRIAKELKGARR